MHCLTGKLVDKVNYFNRRSALWLYQCSGVLPITKTVKLSQSLSLAISEPSLLLQSLERCLTARITVLLCPMVDWMQLPDIWLYYLTHRSSIFRIIFLFVYAEFAGKILVSLKVY